MRKVPYTLRSFVEIAESENRRGRDISHLDPEVRRVTRALHDRRDRYFADLALLDKDESSRDVIRKTYRSDRQELRRARDQTVETAMHTALLTFEEKLSKGEFSFGLREGHKVGTKPTPTYRIESAPDVVYPAKQAADVVKRAARLEAISRNSAVRALQAALQKNYSHAIYKIDVANFFESIDHYVLTERLNTLPDLDSVTTQIIRRLLKEFEAIRGTDTGLPRGVGLSSHLAEFYLNRFDSKLKTHPGVLFYARYVDDIIMVLENSNDLAKVKDAATTELASLKLELNEHKTFDVVTDEQGNYKSITEFDYLGYRFSRQAGSLSTRLTARRKDRRATRLEKALQAWLDTAPNASFPNTGHNGLLLDRVRYLAGNTRLINSKSNVAIGLYFSNSALDPEADELIELDATLEAFRKHHASKIPKKMSTRLAQISFVEMFANQTFLRFRQKRIEQIVSIWKEKGR
ncbi:RNA-directed DNA polymerase [Brevibacterium antiquum]|uniref:antiviral reverse transcriptase Drt3a n=1 Tax=Brevibacterium antiquum TaxID=234835 RepID=UPI0018DF1F6A|nr:antiviral reverse transcriptase Drt3a [Brevibacterium antiquum]